MRWRSISRETSALEQLRRVPAHELLDVPLTASEGEIKAAYRRKARAYHPDFVDPFLKRHGEEVMKLLNRAYELMLERARS
jgi:DnaJ-class molecular chaperone